MYQKHQMPVCGMFVAKYPKWPASISYEGKIYYFDGVKDMMKYYIFDGNFPCDDIGCVVDWLEGRKIATKKVITRTLDTGNWVDVDKAWYIRTTSSPMGYGFAAYEYKKEGLISYEEMKLLML